MAAITDLDCPATPPLHQPAVAAGAEEAAAHGSNTDAAAPHAAAQQHHEHQQQPQMAMQSLLQLQQQPQKLLQALIASWQRLVAQQHSSADGAAALRRFQHYATTLGRQAALLLLRHGSAGLSALIHASVRLARQLRAWATHSTLPGAAAAALTQALRLARDVLRVHLALPLGRLLAQLVWVQVRLSMDDAHEDGTWLAGRLHTAVSLLFGCLRLRSHSCLQLALPSRQPTLSPEFSLSSPCPSPRAAAAPANGSDSLMQQQHSPRRAGAPPPHEQHQAGAAAAAAPFSSSSSVAAAASLQLPPGWPSSWASFSPEDRASLAHALRISQHVPGGAGAAAAGSEVHVLCSAELRAAILSFLQAHSQASGSEFVVLRNTHSSSGSAGGGSGGGVRSARTSGCNSSSPPTPRGWEGGAAAAAAADSNGGAAPAAAAAVESDAAPAACSSSGGNDMPSSAAGAAAHAAPAPADADSSSSSQALAPVSVRQSAHVFVDAAAGGLVGCSSGGSGSGVAAVHAMLLGPDDDSKQQQQQQSKAVAADLQPQVLLAGSDIGSGAAAAAEGAAGGGVGCGSGPDSVVVLQTQDSFSLAAEKFRALAAAAAASSDSSPVASGRAGGARSSSSFGVRGSGVGGAGGGSSDPSDPCSRPLLSFERGSPAPPLRRSAAPGGGSVSARAALGAPGGSPGCAAGTSTTSTSYMRLAKPASRSIEVLTLRQPAGGGGSSSPRAAAAAAAATTHHEPAAGTAAQAGGAGAGGKKRLPAAPFSMSASGGALPHVGGVGRGSSDRRSVVSAEQ